MNKIYVFYMNFFPFNFLSPFCHSYDFIFDFPRRFIALLLDFHSFVAHQTYRLYWYIKLYLFSHRTTIQWIIFFRIACCCVVYASFFIRNKERERCLLLPGVCRRGTSRLELFHSSSDDSRHPSLTLYTIFTMTSHCWLFSPFFTRQREGQCRQQQKLSWSREEEEEKVSNHFPNFPIIRFVNWCKDEKRWE